MIKVSRPPSDPAAPLEIALKRLRLFGLRITDSRISMVEAFGRLGSPSTVERIHAELRPGVCDLVTVYRNLEAFERVRIVRRSFLPGGTTLFNLELGETEFHVMTKDNNMMTKIEESAVVPLRAAAKSIGTYLAAAGYSEVTYTIQFRATHLDVSRAQESPLKSY